MHTTTPYARTRTPHTHTHTQTNTATLTDNTYAYARTPQQHLGNTNALRAPHHQHSPPIQELKGMAAVFATRVKRICVPMMTLVEYRGTITQQNTTQHNTTQHNTTQHNTITKPTTQPTAHTTQHTAHTTQHNTHTLLTLHRFSSCCCQLPSYLAENSWYVVLCVCVCGSSWVCCVGCSSVHTPTTHKHTHTHTHTHSLWLGRRWSDRSRRR